jgi:hypothetical protein
MVTATEELFQGRPAVVIGGRRAIVVDASVGADTTMWVALQLVYGSDPV